MDKHLFLTGFRGTGKTTVGQLLAAKLQRPFIDLDHQIERVTKKNVRSIFADVGEEGFREIEANCLASVVVNAPAVISLGGGAVLRESNRKIIQQTGICIWLKATAENILSRLADDQRSPDQRPALTTLPPLDEIKHLLEVRDAAYRSVASAAFDTDTGDCNAIADQIIQWWQAKE